ncbi:Electron transfer flavoprotein alpha subunit [Ferroglobus placidus DSM 10642]|uniref:Electron transfer flavoprotein alpha subunit n=1 Tax=Ferroglobus placidus (strain DSM 10642 / AEDII12DO) TaxID=589924 RepID=D3S015_FERPA|nr:electron transfer flavoprotein subunit alpha/FixB family protein [Ferroglobus placidus]ADC66078.1 Electron transfer flavoprotein alpha subunit [Ferroglobus placidus DSM 10642]
MRVFAVAEIRLGELDPVSVELLNLANSVKGDGKSEAVVIGKDVGSFAEELAKYADVVWKIEDDSLENYNPELYADVLLQLFEKEKPDLILFPNSSRGAELAPLVASKLNAPIATDVVGVDVKDGIKVSRYIFQGKLMVDIMLKKAECYVLTVRQGVFKEGEETNGEIVDAGIKPKVTPRREFVGIIEPEVGEVDISQADIIVSVGRGIEDASNIELAEELAKLLGGVVAGSRPVIDNGWLPKDRQVGISGKTVKPKLYLALGISGAFQHVMGMKDSELIIAINKDPEAPIFGVAHYGVVGDLFEIVPVLIEKLQKIKG